MKLYGGRHRANTLEDQPITARRGVSRSNGEDRGRGREGMRKLGEVHVMSPHLTSVRRACDDLVDRETHKRHSNGNEMQHSSGVQREDRMT